jgi:hypothetical protein
MALDRVLTANGVELLYCDGGDARRTVLLIRCRLKGFQFWNAFDQLCQRFIKVWVRVFIVQFVPFRSRFVWKGVIPGHTSFFKLDPNTPSAPGLRVIPLPSACRQIGFCDTDFQMMVFVRSIGNDWLEGNIVLSPRIVNALLELRSDVVAGV